MDFQHILDNIRNKLGKSYQRIHLVTRKDIINIERTYCFTGNQRHRDDATSVHLWVEDMNTQGKKPCFALQTQGQIPPQGYENLSHKDFAIAIQTPLQAEILKRFSSDIICVDSTHGTNGYNFSLITVMVIDEYGEGFPMAWCISNREDHPLLLIFYTSLVSGEVSQQDIMEETEMLQRVQDVTQMGQLTIYREGIQNQLIALAGYLNTITDMSTLHDVKALITSA